MIYYELGFQHTNLSQYITEIQRFTAVASNMRSSFVDYNILSNYWQARDLFCCLISRVGNHAKFISRILRCAIFLLMPTNVPFPQLVSGHMVRKRQQVNEESTESLNLVTNMGDFNQKNFTGPFQVKASCSVQFLFYGTENQVTFLHSWYSDFQAASIPVSSFLVSLPFSTWCQADNK